MDRSIENLKAMIKVLENLQKVVDEYKELVLIFFKRI